MMQNGEIVFYESQEQWRNRKGKSVPVCEICGEVIYTGETVVQQGGPHRFCMGKNPLSGILKQLEKELEK